MDKLVNCSNYAIEEINSTLKQVEVINKTLKEKKGNNSRIKIILNSLIYILGILFCIHYVILQENIYTVNSFAGISLGAFFSVLLIRNLLEMRYYGIIHNGECKMKQISKLLTKNKERCSTYYEEFKKKNGSLEGEIKSEFDVEMDLSQIQKKIIGLEKRKTQNIQKILVCIYYVAAMTVGATLIHMIHNEINVSIIQYVCEFNIPESDAQICYNIIYKICAICGIVLGPIVLRYYFEKIKLVQLTDSLILLIIGSSVCFFCLTVAILALIALTIVLVYYIVSWILGTIIGIICIFILIAVIYVLVTGN